MAGFIWQAESFLAGFWAEFWLIQQAVWLNFGSNWKAWAKRARRLSLALWFGLLFGRSGSAMRSIWQRQAILNGESVTDKVRHALAKLCGFLFDQFDFGGRTCDFELNG